MDETLPFKTKLIKWGIPPLIWGLATYFQVIALCINTHYYILWMRRLTNHAVATDEDISINNDALSSEINEGALIDTMFRAYGDHENNKVLNQIFWCISLAIFVYIVICCSVIKGKEGRGNARVWTKMCIVGAMICFLKGFLCLVTVLPDPKGWENCKSELSKDRIQFFETGFNFKESPTGSFGVAALDAFTVIWKNPFVADLGGDYCSNSATAGHASFIILMSLAAIEVTRYVTTNYFGNQKLFIIEDSNEYEDTEEEAPMQLPEWVGCCITEERLRMKTIARFFSTLFWTCLCVFQLSLLLVYRLHYSMDIILNVLFVMLLYTNVVTATSVWHWSQSEHKLPSLHKKSIKLKDETEQLVSSYGSLQLRRRGSKEDQAPKQEVMEHQFVLPNIEGEVTLPPCCPVHCCSDGKYHITSHDSNAKFLKTMESEEYLNAAATERKPGSWETILRTIL